MKSTLIDAGPLIALFHRGEEHHDSVVKFLEGFKGNLATTWPVIAEASYMLRSNTNAQIDFFEWLRREAIQIIVLNENHLDRIIELLKKYSDMPMDLADASLMVVAEILSLDNVISLDSDYYVYKTKSKKALKNLLSDFIKEK